MIEIRGKLLSFDKNTMTVNNGGSEPIRLPRTGLVTPKQLHKAGEDVVVRVDLLELDRLNPKILKNSSVKKRDENP